MTDWFRVFNKYYAVAHADEEYTMVTQPGVSAEELDQMAGRLGINLPDEFCDLYMATNGFGIATDDEPDDIWWLFHPLDDLPNFIDSMRDWFADTHPDVASRFFPFIDFANGDSMGYLTETVGSILPGLFCFEHESYEHDEDQDVDEFLSSIPVTIEELLTPR